MKGEQIYQFFEITNFPDIEFTKNISTSYQVLSVIYLKKEKKLLTELTSFLSPKWNSTEDKLRGDWERLVCTCSWFDFNLKSLLPQEISLIESQELFWQKFNFKLTIVGLSERIYIT